MLAEPVLNESRFIPSNNLEELHLDFNHNFSAL
jgi:hypothetical protein